MILAISLCENGHVAAFAAHFCRGGPQILAASMLPQRPRGLSVVVCLSFVHLLLPLCYTDTKASLLAENAGNHTVCDFGNRWVGPHGSASRL